LKVIIKDKFYEFQNENTENIFDKQKDYLSEIIKKHSENGNLEELLTSLFSLYNLSETLIHKLVEENGREMVVDVLQAKVVD